MIPLSLKITGFLSYRETSELSFDAFELACISGANGAGKSSLLDAITWALFGEARRRDDTVINDAATQAEVIFEFLYENARYRVQRIKKRGKSTLLEFFIATDEGNWKPLTEHAISETEKRIVDILRMDYETFVNASFFLQGKADLFAQQKVADRKRILANILGLEQWDRYKETAAARRREMEKMDGNLAGSMHEIENELVEESARAEKLEQVEKSLSAASALREEKENSIEVIRALARSIEEQKKAASAVFEQLDELEKQLAIVNVQLAERKEEEKQYQAVLEAAGEIEAGFGKWKSNSETLKKLDGLAARFFELNRQRQQAATEIAKESAALDAEKKGLLETRIRVEKAMANRQGILEKLAAAEEQVKSYAAAAELRDEAELAYNKLTSESARLTAENEKLKIEMDELAGRITALKKAGKAECPLCEQELSAGHQQDLLEKLKTEGVQKEDQFRKNQADLGDLKKKVAEQEFQIGALRKNEKTLQTLKQNQVQLEAVRSGLDEQIDHWKANGEARLKLLEAQLSNGEYALEHRQAQTRYESEIQKLGYSEGEHQKLRAEVENLSQVEGRMRQLEKARAALEPLRREISGGEQQAARLMLDVEKKRNVHEQAIAQYEQSAASLPDLKGEEDRLGELRKQENELRLQLGAAKQKVDVLATLKMRLEELKEKQNEIRQDIARLIMLEKAYGKDGIPALLIEQSLPEIEERANEILDRLSGGCMSLRFETQRAMKSREEMREALQIVINDAVGQREYELFSGGEAFRVNFAIRLALSHLLAQRSGARLQTLIIDEGFGSQDAEGRQRLIEAINLVRPDFAKILVITHLEELKDAFPARIEVEKTATGSKLKVVTA